jgi:hypothetical protein
MKAIRTYFRDRLSGHLNEWKDEFNVENVPRSMLEKVYHLGMEGVSFSDQNQHDLVVQCSVRLTFFKIGFRSTSDNADSVYQTAEELITVCTESKYALTGEQVKLVRFASLSVDRVSTSNDNIFVAEILFNVTYIIPINRGED